MLNASRYLDSELRKEVVDLDLDVPGNLPYERRRDISTLVKRDGRCRARRDGGIVCASPAAELR